MHGMRELCAGRSTQMSQNRPNRGTAARENVPSASKRRASPACRPGAQLACHVGGRLRRPALRREARAAVAGGADDVVPRGEQIHAAAKIGAQGADGGGLVLAVGGTDRDDLPGR